MFRRLSFPKCHFRIGSFRNDGFFVLRSAVTTRASGRCHERASSRAGRGEIQRCRQCFIHRLLHMCCSRGRAVALESVQSAAGLCLFWVCRVQLGCAYSECAEYSWAVNILTREVFWRCKADITWLSRSASWGKQEVLCCAVFTQLFFCTRDC